MTAFANLVVCNSPGQLRDVTLYISVELFSKVKNRFCCNKAVRYDVRNNMND
jgi:hypothetical protein